MKRTELQNAALHKYFELLAEALNDAGLDMKKVFEVRTADIPWNKNLVKEALWKTIQEPMVGEKSTTQLETGEVSKVYEVLDRHISNNFGVHVPFPCIDEQLNESITKN